MDPAIVELSREFVCIRVDGDLREDLAMGAKILDYPGLQFLTPEGGVILLTGPDRKPLATVQNDYTNSAARTVHYMKQAVDQRAGDRQRLADAQAAVKADPTSASAWYELGKYWFERKLYADAKEPLEKVLALDPTGAAGKTGFTIERLLGIALDGEAWDRMLELVAAGRAASPDARLSETYIYYEFLYHLRGTKDRAAAHKVVAQMEREFPRGGLTQRARGMLVAR